LGTPIIFNILGAAVAISINLLLFLLFLARLKDRSGLEYWLGIAIIAHLLPLAVLMIRGISEGYPGLYLLQVGLMIVFLITEWLLDYVYRVEFRSIKWMVVLYVTLFFAATGGMIGVAALAGNVWMILAIVTFFAMGVLAFYQRHVTGK